MQYSYVAVHPTSGKQKGLIEANSKKEVVDYLRTNKLIPISIKEVSHRSPQLLFMNRVKAGDLVIFTRQLSSMLNTGLTLLESLNLLKQEVSKPQMKQVIDDLITSISEGEPFSKSLSLHPEVFSQVYVALIRAAETSGLLSKILERLADNLEQQEDLRKRVQSAMIYPLIVVVGIIGVMIIMNVFVIPALGGLYESMGVTLPLSTQIVLAISNFTKNFFPFIIILVIVGFVGFNRLKSTEKGREYMDKIRLKIPVMGVIYQLSALDEVCRTLSLLISSGASILNTLNITSQVANNLVYRNAISSSVEFVQQGVNLSTAFGNQNVFPNIMVQMIKVGESTGKIDEGLLKVAEYFERDLNLKIKNLTTALEPIIIVVLGGVVAFLILSIITPIYGLVSQIH